MTPGIVVESVTNERFYHATEVSITEEFISFRSKGTLYRVPRGRLLRLVGDIAINR